MTASEAVRSARAAWEDRVSVQLVIPGLLLDLLPEIDWPEYAQDIATDKDIDAPGYFDCTSGDMEEEREEP